MLDHTANLPANRFSLSDVVAEYEAKRDGMTKAIATFSASVLAMESAACIGGTYGGSIWDGRTPSAYERTAQAALLKSAWWHVIKGLNIEETATAKDLDRMKTALENPPPLTLDTIRATFGKYLIDPRQHMLRGVAEAFCDLDPAYKSHSKIKIGVAGLPKRIILSWALPHGYATGSGWREGQMRNVLDAMASLHEQPKLTWREFSDICERAKAGDDPQHLGITVRGFANGNAHLIFDADALLAINRALAEFYGDVLPDATEQRDTARRTGTAVSADLAYYPTPPDACKALLSGFHLGPDCKVLEPSCGDGRLMDALEAWARKERVQGMRVTGIEVHSGRADQARARGHHVQIANFLDVAPQPIFDAVVMNPPFAGRHYAKHIAHALKFLKPGGRLLSILPASAWYDHGELPKGGHWDDLPVASFAESGTNVPTGVWSYHA